MTVMNIERKSSEKIESQSRGKRNWKVKTREDRKRKWNEQTK